MLVSTNWLNEYVKIDDQNKEQLAEKITRSGIEVDGIINRSHNMENVVVGHVTSCEKHPNADRLNVCQVDVGGEKTEQIICGAANVAKGQKIVAALPGAVLPGNFKIKKAKMRGEASNGMICSLQELAIEGKVVPKEFADGIYVLPNEAEVGQSALPYIGLDDVVYDFDLTPNRGDALSMLGVAYEVAAILDRDLTLPNPTYDVVEDQAEKMLQVRVDAKEETPLYAAKVVRNIQVGPSPQWMQNVLMAAGIRPHNNVVDITNFVLLEYGQPLHAFDYDRIGSNEIVVRLAKEGETIQTLDDEMRTLTTEDIVITNGKEPIAVAGVMGGAHSEVTDETTTVVIEAAYFKPINVRRTSSRLGLRSDSSARFEKGVDPNRVLEAADRAVQLLQQYANGEVLDGTVLYDELDKTPKTIIVSPDSVSQRLGVKIPLSTMEDILRRLRIPYEAKNALLVIEAPTRRQDLKIEEDIVEEIARMYGYDNIPLTLPVTETTPGRLTPYQEKRRIVRRYLEGAGLYQAVTYSLVSEKNAKRFALQTDDWTQLMMPMSTEHSTLRQSLIPSLLQVVSYNVARRNTDVAMYETSSVYIGKEEDGLPKEVERLAAVFTGQWVQHEWQKETKEVDFFVVKGIVEGLFARLGLTERITYERLVIEDMHPGRTAQVVLDGKQVGFIGEVHPLVEKEFDVPKTYVFELDLHTILNTSATALQYRSISKYPKITRDVALVIDRETSAATIKETILQAGKPLLRDVHIFDLYEGEHIEDGKKSVAYSLTYFDPTRTLTDEEVVKVHDRVLEVLKEKVGAIVRDS